MCLTASSLNSHKPFGFLDESLNVKYILIEYVKRNASNLNDFRC